MTSLRAILPTSLRGQMLAVLAGSFVALLGLLAGLEIADSGNLIGRVVHESTIRRVRHMHQALEHADPERRLALIEASSYCHEGYGLSRSPFAPQGETGAMVRARETLARQLRMERRDVVVGSARLTQADFAYARCAPGEIDLPVNGLVVAARLSSGEWLNAELHPHEWHLHSDLVVWLFRSAAVFFVVGAAALFFVHRLSRPLARLTQAAERFGAGFEDKAVEESGPSDLRRAIGAFNAMQRRVADEVRRRYHVLVAIGHDLRSPLTALRIKAELVEDASARADLLASIEAMERMTGAALEFLRGDSRNEPMREIDLAELVRHECEAAGEAGLMARYSGPAHCAARGRPDALARAVRNLIENANKYAQGGEVTISSAADWIEIAVSDRGPGISSEQRTRALEPFERLSSARESGRGGFGLGLAIVKAVCEGHDGELELRDNSPSGLLAIMRLPRTEAGAQLPRGSATDDARD